jgi:gamma-glutamyltranspeptidase
MCPTIVLRDGRPVLALGARGGRKIPNAVFEVLTQFVALDRTMTEAVAAPRLHTEGNLDLQLEKAWPATDAESADANRLQSENRFQCFHQRRVIRSKNSPVLRGSALKPSSSSDARSVVTSRPYAACRLAAKSIAVPWTRQVIATLGPDYFALVFK